MKEASQDISGPCTWARRHCRRPPFNDQLIENTGGDVMGRDSGKLNPACTIQQAW